ncbi:hypothetical protein CULT_880009 [[Clostridium] ultunense Esp]|nr:hypothetical protein CULT_880009 [[Clostridium] ultunense Esp]
MTSGNWGHANVFNTSNYVEAKKTVTALNDFYQWLVQQEGAVASFNHPNWPSDSFNDLSYVPEIDHMMAMIEVGNGAPPYSYARAEEHFFRAMDNGWHVGVGNAQDNHSTNWGDPDNLTAVVAEDLTTESFLDALRNRRTYSTEARDTQLRVKANGFWMGSTVEVPAGGSLNFDVWVKDQDNLIDKIQLITNGGNVIETKMVGGATEATWNPTVTPTSGANWYVVKVIHSDGKWTTASAIFTVGGEMDVKLTGLDVNPDPSVPGSETILTASVSNMGVRPVTNLEVKFYHTGVSEDNLITTGTLSYLAPNSKGKIEGKWIPRTSGQDQIIAVLTEKPGITTVTEMAKTVKVVASNGKKVLLDAFHNNKEVPGVMNDFLELLRRYGYTAVVSHAELTPELLSEYDLLVLNTPITTAKNLSDQEMEAVSNWVKAGGSLMLATTSNYQFPDNTMLNPLLEKMGSGIRINNDNVYEPNSSDRYSGGMKWSIYLHNFPKTSSGLNENLDAIRYFSGSSLVDENLQALTNDPASDLEVLVAGNRSSYNFNVAPGYFTYNSALGDENDPNQTAGENGDQIPLIAKERIGNGKIVVSGRHWYSDYEIGNDVSNTAFTLRLIDYLAGVDRIKPIREVRNTAKDGEIVTVKGVVTAPTEKFFDTVYIQDETGGIALYGTQGKDLPIGTVVIATGGIQHFEGEMELSYENAGWEVLYVGPGNPVTAKEITLKDVADGTYVGQLVKTKGKIKEINDANSTVTLTDGTQDALLLTDGYLPLDLGRFKVGDSIEAEGIASTGALGHRIRIRFAEDLRLIDGNSAPSAKLSFHVPDRVARGSTFEAGIELSGIEDLYGASLELTFDPQVLQVVDAEENKDGVQIKAGDWLAGADIVNQVDNEKGTIHFVVTKLGDVSGVTGEGTLAIIPFKVEEGVSGSTILTPSGSIRLANSNNDPIPVQLIPATLQIVEEGRAVSGSIKFPGTHKLTDLSGFTVKLLSGDEVIATAVTGTDGKYKLTAPVSGSYTVRIEKEYYLNASMNITLPEGRDPFEVPALTMYVGDFNGDKVVDLQDIALIAQHYGQPESPYDVDRDGDIDLTDIVTVARNYGEKWEQVS